MDKYTVLQQRRGVQENGQSSSTDLRFRAFVAVVLLASGGTVLRACHTIQNDEALTRLQITAPPVVRVVVLADTHGHHRELDVPDGHLLVHAGDVSLFGNLSQMEDFNHWLAMLPHQHKVVIAGNHDAHADGSPTAVTAAAAAAASLQTRLTAATFLSDSGVSLLGMRLWGAPWQSQYPNTGFYLPAESVELAAKWAMIPANVDLLVTHTPPYGACDVERGSTSGKGCKLLTAAALARRPALLACGHLHTARGVAALNSTLVLPQGLPFLKTHGRLSASKVFQGTPSVVNAAVVDDPTELVVASPVVFDCRRIPRGFRMHGHLPSTHRKNQAAQAKQVKRKMFDCVVVKQEAASAMRGLDAAHPVV